MKKIKTLVSSIATILGVFLAACSSDSGTGSDAVETSEVKTVYGLGDCKGSNEGVTKLVTSENRYYTCADGQWSVSGAYIDTVKTDDDLPACLSKNEGDSAFVLSEMSVFRCQSSKWKNSGFVMGWYETKSKLPACEEKFDGLKGFVKNDSAVYVCDGEAWEARADAYASEDDLPNCSSRREGSLAWLLNRSLALVCENGSWDNYVKQAPKSSSSRNNIDGGRSSSSSNKSSSSKRYSVPQEFRLYVLAPDDIDWMTDVMMVSNDGAAGEEMTPVPNTCGWFMMAYYESVPEEVLIYRKGNPEGKIGFYGLWGAEAETTPLPLRSILDAFGSDRLYFVPDDSQWPDDLIDQQGLFITYPGISGRCVKDDDSSSSSNENNTESSSSSISSSSGIVNNDRCDGVVYNEATQICDSRDGQVYSIVTIGTGNNAQTWMAENLNYDTTSSYCNNCDKYGRLYTWKVAKKVCPTGWHLPSKAEFETLFNAVVGQIVAGKMLKSTTGWNYNGNGSDKYGFSALPAGGYFEIDDAGFDEEGDYAYFRSSTEYDSNEAWLMILTNDYDGAMLGYGSKDDGLSVRCLKN